MSNCVTFVPGRDEAYLLDPLDTLHLTSSTGRMMHKLAIVEIHRCFKSSRDQEDPEPVLELCWKELEIQEG